ncbi:unnamed protein product [Gemmata massiliana]|uniref:Uncharacterized protein n=1 Tax=Gemmata massiliana TaxID=1210884 RepID=A0A6P2D9D1_9BACT|nr:unnamed protein product [Gemmata massiliana]
MHSLPALQRQVLAAVLLVAGFVCVVGVKVTRAPGGQPPSAWPLRSRIWCVLRWCRWSYSSGRASSLRATIWY